MRVVIEGWKYDSIFLIFLACQTYLRFDSKPSPSMVTMIILHGDDNRLGGFGLSTAGNVYRHDPDLIQLLI